MEYGARIVPSSKFVVPISTEIEARIAPPISTEIEARIAPSSQFVTLSSSELECPICLDKLKLDGYYAMLRNEAGKYHLQCLHDWLKKRKSGILTQNPLTTYSIYDGKIRIITEDINNLKFLDLRRPTKPSNDNDCKLFLNR